MSWLDIFLVVSPVIGVFIGYALGYNRGMESVYRQWGNQMANHVCRDLPDKYHSFTEWQNRL